MLEIRLACENCAKALPANSIAAMICSYECTFCQECVESKLNNVCPNCGGGFEKRPIRPQTEWVPGVSLNHQKPRNNAPHKPIDPQKHQEFKSNLIDIPANLR